MSQGILYATTGGTISLVAATPKEVDDTAIAALVTTTAVLDDFSQSDNGILGYDGAPTGNFSVSGTISLSTTDPTAGLITATLRKNGAVIAGAQVAGDLDDSWGVIGLTFRGLTQLATGDLLSVYLESANSRDVVVASLSIEAIATTLFATATAAQTDPGPWLTRLDRVKDDFGIASSNTSEDSKILHWIRQATRAIESIVGRSFARESVTEEMRFSLTGDYRPSVFPGYFLSSGQQEYLVNRTPLKSLISATFAGVDYASDVVVSGGDDTLVRAAGFQASLTEPWTFVYVGGYLIPGQDLVAVTEISVDATGKTYTDSEARFPYLVAGDTFEASGFTNAANNGTKTVVSRTTSVITVAESLTDEIAGESVTLEFADSEILDLEHACISLVKLIREYGTSRVLRGFRLGVYEESYMQAPGLRPLSGIREMVLPYARWL